MKKMNTYQIMKQIHLYSSLATVALLLMYIITSYMMIYHDWFKPEGIEKEPITLKVSPEEISDENWESFLSKNKVRGRFIRENLNKNGDLVRMYSSAKGNVKITLFNETNEVEIAETSLNTSGKIIGLHRTRGYGGSWVYNVYALLLDVVGISLILFAITGAFLWLKLLNNSKTAWIILLAGFAYVSSVILYLLYV